MTKDAKQIFEAAVKSVDPRSLMAKAKINIDGFTNVKVFAVGKASELMTVGLIDQLGEKVTSGLVITKDNHGARLPETITAMKSSHPIPDQRSLDAGERLLKFCESAQSGELLIGLISGGASSMVEALTDGTSLSDLQNQTSEMMKSGADIFAVNAARKTTSRIKGGKLAEAIAPAASINFILSDVVGDDLSVIGSGLTVSSDKALKIKNSIIGSNSVAVEAAKAKAIELGFETRVLPTPVTGEAIAAGELFANFAAQLLQAKRPKPVCLIGGGETVVKVRGAGLGGRNQEMALSYLCQALLDKNLESTVFLSGATDGGDGPTDAAGGIFSRSVIRNVELSRLSPKEYLEKNDSYHLFEETGGLLKTGPTGTNVCDIQILLIPASN